MRCHVYEKFVSCLRRVLFNGDFTIPRLDGNENVKNSNRFRASLHGPGWPRLPVFQGLALPLNPFTSYERAGWLGFRDLCFSNRDLGKVAKKFCHMCNSARFPGWTLAARIASSYIAPCIFHIISILFNCSDTAIRIAKAMIIAEVIGFLCFAMFSCFLAFPPEAHCQDIRPYLISETELKFPIWTRGENSSRGNRASPASWAHVKKPLLGFARESHFFVHDVRLPNFTF